MHWTQEKLPFVMIWKATPTGILIHQKPQGRFCSRCHKESWQPRHGGPNLRLPATIRRYGGAAENWAAGGRGRHLLLSSFVKRQRTAPLFIFRVMGMWLRAKFDLNRSFCAPYRVLDFHTEFGPLQLILYTQPDAKVSSILTPLF